METGDWSAGQLLGLSGSYWEACALHAGVRLEIFSVIGDSKLSAVNVAGLLDADPRAVAMLLNALCAMGLLAREKDLYFNTEAGTSFLVKSSSHYVGHMIMHHHHLVEAWSRLDRAVVSGRPVVERRPSEEDSRRESFLMGMFTLAMAIAPGLTREIDLHGGKSLLDMGGGPGTYAIHFCLANPELRATVFDLAATRPFAEETIARFGLSDRIQFASGDYLTDPIEGSYDAVWMSHILHGEGPEDCHMLVEKAVSVLRKGGLLLIHDFILENTLDAPRFPALFSLNMLVNTERGQSYSEGQIREMMAGAGVGNIKRLPFSGPNASGVMAGER
jgi:predicted O-methyltransferase YrrM